MTQRPSHHIRVEFEMTPEAVHRLDEIVERLGCDRAEVARRALLLFDQMTRSGIVDIRITGSDGTPMSFDPQCVLDN